VTISGKGATSPVFSYGPLKGEVPKVNSGSHASTPRCCLVTFVSLCLLGSPYNGPTMTCRVDLVASAPPLPKKPSIIDPKFVVSFVAELQNPRDPVYCFYASTSAPHSPSVLSHLFPYWVILPHFRLLVVIVSGWAVVRKLSQRCQARV
jgi:hypothetical protein